MEHFYNNIDGWFDFQIIYSQMVNKFSDRSHFVEIGAWLGKSTSYMAVEIINSGKNIKFDVIDTWGGSKYEELLYEDTINKIQKSLYDKFIENIRPVLNIINPIIGFSNDIVNNYKDESLDFVFIDASHDYDSVKKDIEMWYPKVKKGGILAGHDYAQLTAVVHKDVNEFFGEENIKKIGTSWMFEK